MIFVPYFDIIKMVIKMKFSFVYTHEIINYLIKIERYKTALEYLYLPTRAKQKMNYEAKLKKTHFSTSIEGNVLSFNQVKRVIEQKEDINRVKAEIEVKNYWDALTFLEKSKQENKQIDLEFIFKLHDIVERKNGLKRIGFREPTPPGVLFAVYDVKTQNPEFIPPESKDIPLLMDNLLNWYKDNQKNPAVIKAAIMHYGFVSIHPFGDGNGRTARLLATYILMLEDYDYKGFNSFEEYYMYDLDGYYRALQMNLPPLFYDGRNNPPNLEIWIEYFLKILVLNAEKIYEAALKVSKSYSPSILDGLSKKDLVLIRYMLENNKEIIKNKELASLYGVTPRAISKWALEWVNKGILKPASGSQRITSYKLANQFRKIKISDLGFID